MKSQFVTFVGCKANQASQRRLLSEKLQVCGAEAYHTRHEDQRKDIAIRDKAQSTIMLANLRVRISILIAFQRMLLHEQATHKEEEPTIPKGWGP